MKINNSFLFGLATGISIGYYLATDDKDQLMENVRGKANQAKNLVEDGIEKGKKVVSDIRAKRNE
ncbi:MAG: hypothetical protein H0W62_07655 [Chitinophagales bacterium]|nr:hypothetical protein [Chitinophagales bacterium]